MKTNETQETNKGIVTNLTIVMGIVGLVIAIPHKHIDVQSLILFSSAALLFIFFPIFKLVENIKTKGVRVGNWTVYRLYPIYFKASIACFGIVFMLLCTVLINSLYIFSTLL